MTDIWDGSECVFILESGDACIGIEGRLYSLETANEYTEGVGQQLSEEYSEKYSEKFYNDTFIDLFRENHKEAIEKAQRPAVEPVVLERADIKYYEPYLSQKGGKFRTKKEWE